jgi:RNA polymerase sigma-70 factor (ECF subfamily)
VQRPRLDLFESPPAAAAPPPEARASSGEIDAATLAGCKAGDEDAFARFVRHYEGKVMALLFRVLGPAPDLEDLAQEVFLRAFRALPRFTLDGPATMTTWLLTIATRLALNDKRRQRWRHTSLDDVQIADGDTPERSRARAELVLAIEAAIATLPIDQCAAFVLAEFHDMTMVEIAAALSVPENTAKTRVFRAREKMRTLLAPHRGDA